MQPVHRTLLAILAIGLGGLTAGLTNMLSIYIIDKMNGRLPSNTRISIFLWAGFERRRYEQMFPQSYLFRILYCSLALSLLFFVAGLWLW